MHYSRVKRHGDLNAARKVDTSYRGVHKRVARERGKAVEYPCIDCGAQALQWSYNGLADDELTHVGEIQGRLIQARYSPNPVHYEPRCGKCHANFDRRAEPSPEGRKGKM